MLSSVNQRHCFKRSALSQFSSRFGDGVGLGPRLQGWNRPGRLWGKRPEGAKPIQQAPCFRYLYVHGLGLIFLTVLRQYYYYYRHFILIHFIHAQQYVSHFSINISQTTKYWLWIILIKTCHFASLIIPLITKHTKISINHLRPWAAIVTAGLLIGPQL